MTANSHIDINPTGRLSSNREISHPLYSGDRILKWHFQKEILKTLTFKISTYTQHALVTTKASILSKAITLLRIQIDVEIFVLFFFRLADMMILPLSIFLLTAILTVSATSLGVRAQQRYGKFILSFLFGLCVCDFF